VLSVAPLCAGPRADVARVIFEPPAAGGAAGAAGAAALRGAGACAGCDMEGHIFTDWSGAPVDDRDVAAPSSSGGAWGGGGVVGCGRAPGSAGASALCSVPSGGSGGEGGLGGGDGVLGPDFGGGSSGDAERGYATAFRAASAALLGVSGSGNAGLLCAAPPDSGASDGFGAGAGGAVVLFGGPSGAGGTPATPQAPLAPQAPQAQLAPHAAGGASGEASRTAWGTTDLAESRSTILQARCRKACDLRALVPMLPEVSPSDVRMPSLRAARDSRGRLSKEAAQAWETTFAPVQLALARGVNVKEATMRSRWGRIGLFNEFLKAAGFGPFFVESAPGSGKWAPDVDDDGNMVKVSPRCIAFFLATMANEGRGKNDFDELVLVGALLRVAAVRVALAVCVVLTRWRLDARCFCAASKNGTKAYRSREGVAMFMRGLKHGEVLKEHT
jgi:hypothetical protein